MRRLDIEPLEKARWERIERSLGERLEQEQRETRRVDSSPRPRLALVMLAGAAAAVIGAVAWEGLRPSTHVKEAPATTRVETQGMPAHVEFGEARLEVSSHSSARIEGTDSAGVVVSLEHGAIECEVPPRHGRPPFIVHAGDVDVRVVGTHFRVERDDVAARVTVERGAVEVESHGMTTLVHAGSTWPDTHPEKPEPTQASTQEAPPPAATARPTVTVATSEVVPPPIVQPPTPRERYEHALTLEASQPDEALAIYREIAAGEGSWAMNALYAEARLELERGHKDVARQRLADYLQRYPTGPNANDARELSSKLK